MNAQVNPRYVSILRETLTEFHDGVGSFIRTYDNTPAPASQARKEEAMYSDPESVVSAWSIGTQLIEFGGDHLSSFVKIITEPIEPIAAWTSVRSMLESCSLSAWLLDPDIDAHTRVGRTYALRYEGMRSELKLMRATGHSQADIDRMKDRIDSVEQDAIRSGFAPVVTSKGKRIGIGRQMPSPTEMIQDVLGDGSMYCMLSAVTHGHVFAIRGLNYEEAGAGTVGQPNVKTFKKMVNVTGIALLGICAAKAFARPLWNQCRYFGWDELRLEELLEDVFDKLQGNPDKRFWRSYEIRSPARP